MLHVLPTSYSSPQQGRATQLTEEAHKKKEEICPGSMYILFQQQQQQYVTVSYQCCFVVVSRSRVVPIVYQRPSATYDTLLLWINDKSAMHARNKQKRPFDMQPPINTFSSMYQFCTSITSIHHVLLVMFSWTNDW